ncbi:hypothetical protein [Rubrivirga sp. IMCC43871]|uniref:hypothetical protein n=1 Tax=Rubrivirga sp. IMCC43871 TaxID=3391575 RepID=UPI00398FBDAE
MRRPLLLLALALGACDAAGGDTLTVAVVSGDGQRGLAGQPLAEVVVIEVRRGGAPAAGVSLALAATDGGRTPATVRTSASGRAATTWTLGDGAGRQQLAIDAEGARAEAVAEVVPDAEADRIVVAGGAVRGAIVLADVDGRRVVVRERTTGARDIPLVPFDGGTATVVVFGVDGPPTIRTAAWTPGADRIEVALRAPLAVEVRAEIQEPPFPAHRDAALRDAARMSDIWQTSGLGLTVGAVDVIDRTTLAPTVTPIGPCPPTAEATRSVVRYVTDIPGYQGFACPGGVLYMDAHTGQRGLLLAHEFGHQFGLRHTTAGVMNQSLQGAATVTDGEILRAYVFDGSDLNTRLEATPAAERRSCGGSLVVVQPCLDTGYRLPG